MKLNKGQTIHLVSNIDILRCSRIKFVTGYLKNKKQRITT
jgi:hypothetical protein